MGNAFELNVKLASLKVKYLRPFQTKNDWLSGECEKRQSKKGSREKRQRKKRGREKRQPDLSKVSRGYFWSISRIYLDYHKDLSSVSQGSSWSILGIYLEYPRDLFVVSLGSFWSISRTILE